MLKQHRCYSPRAAHHSLPGAAPEDQGQRHRPCLTPTELLSAALLSFLIMDFMYYLCKTWMQNILIQAVNTNDFKSNIWLQ